MYICFKNSPRGSKGQGKWRNTQDCPAHPSEGPSLLTSSTQRLPATRPISCAAKQGSLAAEHTLGSSPPRPPAHQARLRPGPSELPLNHSPNSPTSCLSFTSLLMSTCPWFLPLCVHVCLYVHLVSNPEAPQDRGPSIGSRERVEGVQNRTEVEICQPITGAPQANICHLRLFRTMVLKFFNTRNSWTDKGWWGRPPDPRYWDSPQHPAAV